MAGRQTCGKPQHIGCPGKIIQITSPVVRAHGGKCVLPVLRHGQDGHARIELCYDEKTFWS